MFYGQIDKLYTTEKHNENAALLKGILLGDIDSLSIEQEENFRASNLSHILAVSGMHIAYVILATTFFLKLFRISKLKIHIIVIFVIIFFTFLTNFTPSVVRAAIMASISLIAFIFKRKPDFWNNISIASLFSLILNPYTLLSLSFQLSYLGTIGIVLGLKIYKKRRTKIEDKHTSINDNKESCINKKLKQLKCFFIDTAIICISAQVIIVPILLLNFNTFSLYFLLANVAAAPLIGIITILGFIIIIMSYIIFPMANLLNVIENTLLLFLNLLTKHISNLPNAIIYFKTPFIFSILIYFFVFFTMTVVYTTEQVTIKRKIQKNLKRILKFITKIILIYVLIIFLIDTGIFRKNKLEVYFIDVGQGDSSLIITEENKKILIDGGGSNDEKYDVGQKVTLPYLLDRRINDLDYVVVSHFDSDHVQGLYAILENIKVKNVVISTQYEKTENYEKFMEIVYRKKINIINVKKDDKIQIDKFAKLEILFPLENHIKENRINNNSIVCKFMNRGLSILYTGDIEKIAEDALVKLYKNTKKLSANILKIAHHGSKTSSTENFLNLVNPRIAIISVSKDNLFKHPNSEVIKRLESRNIIIRRTDLEGEIILKYF